MGLSAGNYDDLFENIGEFVQRINDFYALYAALDTDFSELKAEFIANDRLDIYEGLETLFDSYKANLQGWITSLAAYVDRLLVDRDTIIENFPTLGGGASLQNVLLKIYDDMANTASESMVASVVTLGSVTSVPIEAGRSNLGTVLVGKVLDGYQAPLTGGISNPFYNEVDSQLSVDHETMVVTCLSDAETSGLTAGTGEAFSWNGGIRTEGYHWQDEGSGQGPSLTPLGAYTILKSTNFNTPSATNTPASDWDVDYGTVGTEIFNEVAAVGTATFTFGDTEFDDVNNGTIRLIDTAGTSVTYTIKNDYSATDSSQQWNAGASVTACSDNFVILVNGDHGHNGTITAVHTGDGVITLTQAVKGTAGNSTITTAASFDNCTDVNAPATFTGGLDTGHRGDGYLRLRGTTNHTTIKISQDVVATELQTLRRYCLTAWLKKTGGIGSGDLTIQFEGTGYTASSSEKIYLNTAALDALSLTTYSLEHFYINIPRNLPADFELVIKSEGTLDIGVDVFIDDIAFGPVTYHGGVHAVIVAGTDDWLKDDYYTFTVANNDAGVFQTFFRKWYRVQMPTSGAPTVADSLAT